MSNFDFLVYLVFLCLIFLILHVGVVRFYWRKKAMKTSPQNLIIKLCAVTNIFVFAFSFWMLKNNNTSELIFYFAYIFLFYNSFCYSYFVVFQLSETGRRIRILRYMNENTKINIETVFKNYSVESMVKVRLERLYKMGQIEIGPDKRFRINNRFFIRVAKIFTFLSLILIGKKNRVIVIPEKQI